MNCVERSPGTENEWDALVIRRFGKLAVFAEMSSLHEQGVGVGRRK